MNARSFTALGLGLALGGAILAAPHVLSAQTSRLPERQGWDAATTTEYHHKSQGAVIVPAAFMRALRTPSGRHFLDPANMASYGFLPASDGGIYPLGMAADDGNAQIENGIPMVGANCAACHTGQLTVKGATLRIEGGSANLDITRFLTDVDTAILADAKDPAKRKAFLAEAISYGYPASKASAGLDAEANRRIFMYQAAARNEAKNTPSGPGIVDALTGIAFNAMTTGLHDASNARPAKAPTNYPPVWDIWHFDWVQYNASVRQPMGRNVGEAIGLGARLNIVDAKGDLNPASTRWKSTVNVKSLFWIETALESLKPPTWPSAFGAIDQAKVAAGKALFAQNCSRCHGVNVIAGSASHEWYLPVIPLAKIGTDPNQAIGFAKTTFNATKIGASATEGGPEGLFVVVGNVKDQAYKDAGIPKSEWPTYDGFDRKMIVAWACGYRPRPLVGLWATPPFLHNGSVPSVYDMLSQTRPSHPIIGNPEFDPVKLGQVQVAIPGRTYTMDTALQGNSNAGHWFANDATRKGRIGRALTDTEKYDLIEYLKVATYANYPSRTINASDIPAQPCGNDRNWAANVPY
jgi:cytochrome c553